MKIPGAVSEKRGGESGSNVPEIEIRPLRIGDDGSAFRALNEEWITRYFVLENKDHETLEDPESTILRKGGHIFMVYAGNCAVGCVALIPTGDGVYELSKWRFRLTYADWELAADCLNMPLRKQERSGRNRCSWAAARS